MDCGFFFFILYLPSGNFSSSPTLNAIMTEERVFGPWDYVVFALMLVISAGIGLFYAFTGGKQKTTKEFLMADRSMKLLPIAVSILVSFISAILILGTPAEMYTAGTEYWMLAGGMSMANLLAAIIFVPMLHPLKLTSSYEVRVPLVLVVFDVFNVPIPATRTFIH